MSFEMARADAPEEIVRATQRSVIQAMQDLVNDLKVQQQAPGLTWEQIEYLFEKFKDKQPKIFIQDGEM